MSCKLVNLLIHTAVNWAVSSLNVLCVNVMLGILVALHSGSLLGFSMTCLHDIIAKIIRRLSHRM